jgi:hypothetical protein
LGAKSGENVVKIALIVVAGLVMLSGAVWFFQGVGALPGSYMTGQTRWALYGGLAFIAGAAILAFALRRRSRRPRR